MTVGPHTTDPPRIAHAVCWVRSTQMVNPEPAEHFARSVAVWLVAIRRATSAVLGPARPWAGLIPYRFWNFLIAAQSSADWTPSTVTDPYPPICARAASTSRWRSPCGQTVGGWGFGAGGGAEVADRDGDGG